MGFQVPNSNQFGTGNPTTVYQPSDFTLFTPGADLPTTQQNEIAPDDTINIQLTLRRKQFTKNNKPSNYIEAERLIELPYKKQLQYSSSLTNKTIRSWYGASDADISAVTGYLAQHGATDISINQEQRTASFNLTYEQFRSAFLQDRPEILVNETDGNLFYYNPANYEDSYLTSSGPLSQEFATAIIGITVSPDDTTIIANQEQPNASLNTPSNSSSFNYYPSEIADSYNFPRRVKTNQGKGVVIGMLGSGGNQFDLLNQGNAFNRYLKAQSINTRKLGRVDSPNDAGPENEWGESAMDFSILRSIAPQADLKVSSNDSASAYQELIYDKDVDIISSSVGLPMAPGTVNQWQALHELFVDALLRGKTVVVAAGDQGTGNYENAILPNGKPNANFFDADSAVLSVGGTALSPKAQLKAWPRATVTNPTSMPPYYSEGIIDTITGLRNQQLTWNDYDFTTINDAPSNINVYPTLEGQFTPDDFIGATLVGGLFSNRTGSSGAFNQNLIDQPSYQKKNLDKTWQETGRRYPDVSVLAGGNVAEGAASGYYVFDLRNGQPVLGKGSGTSAAAPLLAGLLANITSGLRKRFGKQSITGFINPYLYEKYNSKARKDLLFDVPAGSNNASVFSVASSPDQWSGRLAAKLTDFSTGAHYYVPLNGTSSNGTINFDLSSTGKGFDAATGLGSINGQALFNGLSQVWASL